MAKRSPPGRGGKAAQSKTGAGNALWFGLGAAMLLGAVVVTIFFTGNPDSTWSSSFGTMDLYFENDVIITGEFEEGGTITAIIDRDARVIRGHWVKEDGEHGCPREHEGSDFWGQLIWKPGPHGELVGMYSHCDQVPSSKFPWHAQMIEGADPFGPR